ncbi:MAG: hypothetical protein U1E89_09085 [Burkholderiaceae bacterium]
MDRIAVFVDSAQHAKRLIEPMLGQRGAQMQWIVVGCPPRLSRHVGRWVSQASRAQWHRRWQQALRSELEPLFAAHGAGVEWVLAQGRLEQLSARLKARHGAALPLLDARMPKAGRVGEPLQPTQPAGPVVAWRAPVAVSSSLAVMLALAD